MVSFLFETECRSTVIPYFNYTDQMGSVEPYNSCIVAIMIRCAEPFSLVDVSRRVQVYGCNVARVHTQIHVSAMSQQTA